MKLSAFILPLIMLQNSVAHHESWYMHSDVPDNHTINFRLVLPQQNVDQMLSRLESISDIESSSYGNYMTQEEIVGLMSPPLAHRNYILDQMDGFDLSCVDGGDYMSCSGTVCCVNEAFGVNMKYYMNDQNMTAIRSNTTYSVPGSLLGFVNFIDGLSNHLIPYYPIKNTREPQSDLPMPPDAGYVSREVIQRLYSITNATVTHGSTGAAIEFQDGGFVQSDLDQASHYNNLSPNHVTCTHGSNLGYDIETMLDMDMMIDIASNLSMCYLNYDTWIYEFATSIQNMTNRPSVASVSYGWSESDQCSIVACNNETAKQYIDRANIELAKLGVLGVTVVVASGDAGAPGRTSEDCDVTNPINPVFPGSSPYVVSVGATYVVATNDSHTWDTPLCNMYGCANGTITKSINFNDTGWTSGSGFSIYPSTRPTWQNDVVDQYLNSGVYLPSTSTWNSNGRGYPDVVTVGHNCAIYGSNTFSGVDGTSCSAPVFAAMLVLLNDYQLSQGRPVVGFVNPVLYKMASMDRSQLKLRSPFTRPVGGNTHCTEYGCCSEDFGFQTAPNQTTWDPVTGLGSPHFNSMVQNMNFFFGQHKKLLK